ncbi:hypothetical protein ACVWWR_003993 [Bradyrhizobium sp. LM3.2]
MVRPAGAVAGSSPGSQINFSTAQSLALAARAGSTKSGPAASTFAPELFRMKLISSGLSMKLIGTSTAPIRATANRSAAKACELRDSTARRSPFLTPRPSRPRLSRLQIASISANVQLTLPQLTASLSGSRPAERRRRSPMECSRAFEMVATMSPVMCPSV